MSLGWRRRSGRRAPLARAEAEHGAHERRARAAARSPHASRARRAAAPLRVWRGERRLRDDARPIDRAS